MSTASHLATIERPSGPSSIVPMARGSEAIQSAIETLKSLRSFVGQELVDGVDFGAIPGTTKKGEKDKKVLLLPGAQKTALYFNTTARFTHKRTELGNGHLEVESLCLLELRSSGDVVAEGSGSCSTMESKYRTRNEERVCPVCGKSAIIKGKAEYGGGWLCYAKKGGCNAKFLDGDASIEAQITGKVDNPDIWDSRNTVLKMAAKRAQIAAALNLGAMSELFTQDLDEPHLAEQAGFRQESPPRDDRGRDEVNETFKPPAKPAPERDSRPFAQLVSDGVEAITAEFTAAYPASRQKLPVSYSVCRHLYRVARETGGFFGGEPVLTKNAEISKALAGMYGSSKEHRGWIRKELVAYLGTKLAEAKQREEDALADHEGDDDEAGDVAAKLDRGEMYDPNNDDSLGIDDGIYAWEPAGPDVGDGPDHDSGNKD